MKIKKSSIEGFHIDFGMDGSVAGAIDCGGLNLSIRDRFNSYSEIDLDSTEARTIARELIKVSGSLALLEEENE